MSLTPRPDYVAATRERDRRKAAEEIVSRVRAMVGGESTFSAEQVIELVNQAAHNVLT